MSIRRSVLLLVVFVIIAFPASAQIPDTLTVEWLYSAAASRPVSTPAYRWLDDSRLVVYERGEGGAAGMLYAMTVATGDRITMVDLSAARTSLQSLLGDATPATVPFPDVLEGKGRRALYTFSGDIFLLDLATAAFTRVTDTPSEEKCVTVSPDGASIGFVRDNDLYVYSIASGTERRLTSDGSATTLNATLSWVYWEEIFGRNDSGYWWSPDSRAIAYFQFDDSRVSTQHYVDVKPWTPRVIRQAYPKVGEPNPSVRVGVTGIEAGATRWIDLAPFPYEYIVRIGWLPDGKQISIQTLNRLQTRRELLLADPQSGAVRRMRVETDSTWVGIFDGLTFLNDGSGYIWPSEKDGYQHLYMSSLKGDVLRPITHGAWTLREAGGVAWVQGGVVFVDQERACVYFTALEKSALERHLYAAGFDGKHMQRLTSGDGTHSVTFSPDGRYFVDRFSSVDQAPSVSVHERNGALVRVIHAGKKIAALSPRLVAPEFLAIPARDGFALPAQILRPKEMVPGKKYPVILNVYGGPSAPTVVNGWQREIFWENLLAQEGFIVMHMDNRAATGISKRLEETIHQRLVGPVELNDMVDAVRWIKQLPYVDSARIGIWGWSGGGSNTMLGMTRSTEFKAGIAVAGVTDFRFYDSRFAEQYMRTEKENLAGFEENSLLRYAKDLHGRLMLVHGTYDDNVHIQNTWAFVNELVKANKQFDLMVYPMRMHGIADRPARIHLYTAMLEFWKRWL
jgi:dipeptidyl-peptidase-4